MSRVSSILYSPVLLSCPVARVPGNSPFADSVTYDFLERLRDLTTVLDHEYGSVNRRSGTLGAVGRISDVISCVVVPQSRG